MKVSDFVPGTHVKVVGPFRSNFAHLRRHVGWIGRVVAPYSGHSKLVRVGFGPDDDSHFPIKSLERGRVEWIPEDS